VNSQQLEEKGIIFGGRTDAGVGQDKYAPGRINVASGEPVPPDTQARKNDVPSQNKHHGSGTRQTQQIAGWVLPPLKARIQAMAKTEGLSESKVVGALVEKALQYDADVHYGAMLRPVIQDQIHKDIQSATTRTATLGLQAYYAAEQTRILTIHLLRFILGEAIDELPLIIAESQKQAWANMRRHVGDEERGEEYAGWQS